MSQDTLSNQVKAIIFGLGYDIGKRDGRLETFKEIRWRKNDT